MDTTVKTTFKTYFKTTFKTPNKENLLPYANKQKPENRLRNKEINENYSGKCLHNIEINEKLYKT